MHRRLYIALFTAAALAGCGGGEEGVDGGTDVLTIYSGRQEVLVGELIERFEEQSGEKVEVRYGDSAELAATIAEEGDNSPADVFFSQDAGALGAVEEALAPLRDADLAEVDERYRDPAGRWVGVSGRSRVVAYNTERVSEGDLPDKVLDLAQPQWRGRVGIAPPNASFQAFVSALRLSAGDEEARAFLQALKDNGVKTYENNIQTLEAIARGEVDVGLVNHYYLAEIKAETPGSPVANHFLAPGDPGSLVNVSGAAILKTADSPALAQRFVEFLLSEPAQTYFVEETTEYPLVAGVPSAAGLPELGSLRGPDVRLGDLGGKLESTLAMLDDVGLAG
jgi:iron(III) transport system substrate-binding protein